MPYPIIIYGGSFDPPHNGHINTALAVQKHLRFEKFIFLPCKIPVLKTATKASAEQRLHMLQLAIEDYPEFSIDTRELMRDGPSYMVETLQSFRQELGEKTPITLLLGIDAFSQLPQWYCWQQLLSLCNVLVISRADFDDQALPTDIKTLLLTQEINDKKALLQQAWGNIYRYDAGQYLISSSMIRQKIQAGHDVSAYLPANVLEYIKIQALYQ